MNGSGRLRIVDEEESAPVAANIEAEGAFLGACLIDNKCVEDTSWLPVDAFYEPVFGRIWALILREVGAGRTANPVTLAPYLKDDPAIIQLGGPGYLAGLTGTGAVLIGYKDFAQQISHLHQARLMSEALKEALEAVNDFSQPISPLAMASRVDEIVSRAMMAAAPTAAEAVSVASILQKAADHHDDVRDGNVAPAWQVDDLPEINKALGGGANPGDLIVLAGRPGMAKTATALKIANAFATAGHGVAFFSLEMSKEQLAQRQIADLCYDGRQDDFTYRKLKEGGLTTAQRRHLDEVISRSKELPMFVDDRAEVTVSDIIGRIRRLKRRFEARGAPLRLVVIDYLGLIQASKTYAGQKTNEISEITRALKIAAKNLGVAILLLSQLSRAVEMRDNKRPVLSDLRDSGSIEQDADAVLFLYRDEYYLLQAEPDSSSSDAKKIAIRAQWEIDLAASRDKLELIAGKVRGGSTGKQDLFFFGAYQAVRSGNFFKDRI